MFAHAALPTAHQARTQCAKQKSPKKMERMVSRIGQSERVRPHPAHHGQKVSLGLLKPEGMNPIGANVSCAALECLDGNFRSRRAETPPEL